MGDHRATEEELRESGMTWTVLRNAQCADALVEAGARMPLRTPPRRTARPPGVGMREQRQGPQ
ncbi:hypothetical protein ACWD25_58280, partial [Streptomyces sp. NPDC002920]